ncbi:MAG: Jag N-terminal domain-containing protein, partial [Oscillospiraceae bacterium]|nr:Jag N-terminal domain-containing protein [Oscillospiraceae bacterium]
MEKYIITTGKSIDLAINAALAELHLERDAVSVEVLENAKSGFLGIGSSPAKVKVSYEVPDPKPAEPAP